MMPLETMPLETLQGIVADIPYITQTPSDMTMGYYPVVLLIATGLLCTLVAKTYLDNPKQAAYRLSVLMGIVLAPILALYCVVQYLIGDWGTVAIAFCAVASFTLALRPVLKWNIAFTISALVAIIIYYAISLFVSGLIEFTGVSGLILISAAVSVLVFHILSMTEAGLEVVGRILNAWPIIMVIGLVAIVEGVAIFLGASALGMIPI